MQSHIVLTLKRIFFFPATQRMGEKGELYGAAAACHGYCESTAF